jgi:hypothetical protein
MHASEAERKQLELYALAASHDQASLAKEASEGLYAYPPDALTDDLARQMGAIYLRRLLGLRLARVDALKRIVITGPSAHAPTAACGPAQAQALERAWTLAAMSLGTEARAGAPRLPGYLSCLADLA